MLKFEDFIKKHGIILFSKLSDVLTDQPAPNLKVGDMVMFTNDYGVTFGPYKILGFASPDKYGNCVYFDHDAYWCPCRVDQVKQVN